jgi:hypothetical protein
MVRTWLPTAIGTLLFHFSKVLDIDTQFNLTASSVQFVYQLTVYAYGVQAGPFGKRSSCNLVDFKYI